MTETSTRTDPSGAPRSADITQSAAQAGALLRAARQQQGLHIAALAASIKVTPAKLEALESGRTHELLDATFTRALAQAVCRVLKIDAAPVLALLPGAPPGSLERVDSGLNTPFRERSGRGDMAGWLPWRRPVLWLAGLLLAAAAAFVLVPGQPGSSGQLSITTGVDGSGAPVMPPGGPPNAGDAAAPATAEPAASAGAGAAAPATNQSGPPVTTTTPGPAGAAAVAAPPGAAATASQAAADAALVLRALQATWVQATDGSGQTLMARLVPAGETVVLTPALPVRLRIGNASGTELQFRGKPVDLASTARDNIANIILP